MAKTIYPKQPRLKSRKRPWYVYVFAFFICFCLMTAGVVFYIMKVNPQEVWIFDSPGESSLDGVSELNILVAGLDSVDGIHRTDSILVAHVNLKDKFTNVISVPRDLRVEIPGRGKNKINAAYVWGGKDLLIKTLENLLGTKIDYYAVISLDAAQKTIDAMGGVDLDVEKNLHYRDRAQDLNINLKKGFQHLDGEHAMQYARFRHDVAGDFGRIERQQKLIKALAKKATSVEIIARLPQVIIELSKNDLVETNLSFGAIRTLIKKHDEQFSSNIRSFMLPGQPEIIDGISFVLPDMEELPFMVNGLLKGGYHPRNSHVDIIVKNGCGSPMMAQNYKRRLEYFGFRVLGTENAKDFDYKRTLVIVRKMTPFSDSVAKLLGAEKVSDPQPDSVVHLEVVIGKDKLDY